MKRRDFLALRTARMATFEVSCERLFMRYTDAVNDGSERQFLERTAHELTSARCIRLKDAFWLERNALGTALEPILAEHRARGGTVEIG
jgi:hypothetical protein